MHNIFAPFVVWLVHSVFSILQRSSLPNAIWLSELGSDVFNEMVARSGQSLVMLSVRTDAFSLGSEVFQCVHIQPGSSPGCSPGHGMTAHILSHYILLKASSLLASDSDAR